MTSDRWRDIDRLYHAALERSTAERPSFLDHACGGDDGLRQEVESLLRYQLAADGFLERPALQDAAKKLAGEITETWPDPKITGYTIVRSLGEGGMGVVYLAEQTAPIQRQVALKLIKHGMDTRQVVARFEGERQALAMMHHPHIAAVFDAGTATDGRPYFVMEYVDGVPITAYCDRRRLSTRARLELFMDVCTAVQHAHQKGVIHRDLKPSNVLVSDQDGRPMPKIIDFGIAKAIQPSPAERATLTEQGVMVGTPEYMSPEQAALSPDIDTTTDVYSLGVLLYELLAGALPFDPKKLREKGYDEMRRVIRECDPPKPSVRLAGEGPAADTAAGARQTDATRLTRHLRGDLDWITLKALEKDRRRRYATVAAFAGDVERFLCDLPIEARPPSVAYRMRKFTRRYRGAVAAVSAVFVVLVAGLTVSIIFYARADALRVEADRQTALAKDKTAAAEKSAQKEEAQRRVAEAAMAETDRSRVQAETQRKFADANARDAADQRVEADSAKDEATRQTSVAKTEAAKANALLREAEYNAYVSNIGAADGALRSNLAGAARDYLEAVPAAQRGWEWQHLFLKTDASLATLASPAPCARPGEAESAPITNSDNVVALRNRGTRIYLRRCATLDRWDAPSYTHLSYQAAGRILAVGPAGEMLVLLPSGSRGRGGWYTQLVDPSNRELGRMGPFDAQPICADISPNGARVAVGLQPAINQGEPMDDVFELWDVRTAGRIKRMLPLKPLPPDTRNANPTSCLVAFSPDSTRVASSGATVYVWNALTGSKITNDEIQAGTVGQPIAWNADGFRLAIGRYTGLVDILNVARGTAVDHLDGNGFVRAQPIPDSQRKVQIPGRRRNEVLSLAFSEDGTRLVSSADLGVGVWDLQQGKLMHELAGHAAEVTGVAVASGGLIVSGDASGKVKLWPSDTMGAVTRVPGSFSPFGDFALSADGTTAAVAQMDGGLYAWGLGDLRQTVLRAGRGELDIEHIANSLAFSRDGNRLLAADYDDVGTVQTWAVASWRNEAHAMRLNANPEAGCEKLPAENADEKRYNGVGLMALSPDGRALAFRQGRCLVVRDIVTQRTVNTLREYPTSIAFLPDGSLLVASYQWRLRPTGGPGHARVRIWDWRTDTVRREAPTPATATDYELVTSPWRIATCAGGSRIVLAGGRPAVVSIWDGGLTGELGRLPVPPDTQRVACSPDGHRIATSASDLTIRIWDADRRQLLLTLTDEDLHAGGLAFTLDGRLVAGRASGGLTIWETRPKRLPGGDR